MTQEWISDKDRRWQMHCDTPGCRSVAEPTEARRPLEDFRQAGSASR